MQLQSITYQFSSVMPIDDWQLDTLQLQKLNLIVGKNGTGKTRTLNSIYHLSQMLSGRSGLLEGDWELVFIHQQQEIYYSLNISMAALTQAPIIKELIVVDGKEYLNRNQQNANIFSSVQQKTQNIHPPLNKLVLHIRRDQKEYPFLEQIALWAEKTFLFQFGKITAQSFTINNGFQSIQEDDQIAHMTKSLAKTSKRSLIQQINEIGYAVTDINVRKINGKEVLTIKERHLEHGLTQYFASQGMLRTIYLLIFLHYCVQQNKANTILIDDLGEGIDYERSINLGKLLFEWLEDTDIQLIVSSNNSFLMDIVDIQYWNILRKEQTVIKAHNYANSKAQFDEFLFTGLTNFDLFASDYLMEIK